MYLLASSRDEMDAETGFRSLFPQLLRRSEDTTLKRQVALKVLPVDLASNQDRLDRFQREAETLAAIDHPNIVHLYTVEAAEVSGQAVHFLTMQLVRGERLSDLLTNQGLSVDQVLGIAIPLVDMRPIRELLPQFTPLGFLQIHREYLVNLRRIRQIRRRDDGRDWEVKLEPGKDTQGGSRRVRGSGGRAIVTSSWMRPVAPDERTT